MLFTRGWQSVSEPNGFILTPEKGLKEENHRGKEIVGGTKTPFQAF